MQSLAGVSTEVVWERRVAGLFTSEEVPVYFISVEDLVTAKLAAGRQQDLADVAAIRKAQAKLRELNIDKAE